MSSILVIVFLLCFIALITGLFKPSLVIHWGNKKTRGYVFLVYGIGLIVSFVMLGLINEHKEAPLNNYETIDVRLSVNVNFTDDGKVYFSGKTNLPNSSKLIVFLHPGGSTKVIVDNGKFETEIFSDKGKTLSNGRYEVSVVFTLFNQSKEVIKIIGEEGQNLIGELVSTNDINKTKMVDISKSFEFKAGTKVVEYNFKDGLHIAKSDEPLGILIKFLNYVKNKNYKQAAKLLRYRDKNKRSLKELEKNLKDNIFGIHTISSFRIEKITRDAPLLKFYKISVVLKKKNNPVKKYGTIKPGVLRENKKGESSFPGNPGRWGINYITLLTLQEN